MSLRKDKNSLGYTLIELLIVISLFIILSGIGLASYLDISRTQTVNQEAKKIYEELRYAQSLASNNQKPSDATVGSGICTMLGGYNFVINNTSKTYTITPVCLTGTNSTWTKSGNLSSVLTYSGPTTFYFKVLRQGAQITGGTGGNKITVSGYGSKTRYVVVCDFGEIYYKETDPGDNPCQ